MPPRDGGTGEQPRHHDDSSDRPYIPKGKMDAEVKDWLRDVVRELVFRASIFEPGTVPERREGMLRVRESADRAG